MAITPNYSWPLPDDTDLVKDGAEAIRDLGNAIDTTVDGLPSGGLVHIETQTFSAVAAHSVNDVFSATYDNYKIIINALGTTTTQSILMRLRVGGADNTSTIYRRAQLDVDTSTAATRVTNDTNFFTGRISSTNRNANFIELRNPFTTNFTSGLMFRTDETSGSIVLAIAGIGVNVNDSFTGFTMIPGAGLMTGSVSIFGYAKA